MKTKLFGLDQLLIVVNQRVYIYYIYLKLIPPFENDYKMKTNNDQERAFRKGFDFFLPQRTLISMLISISQCLE